MHVDTAIANPIIAIAIHLCTVTVAILLVCVVRHIPRYGRCFVCMFNVIVFKVTLLSLWAQYTSNVYTYNIWQFAGHTIHQQCVHL
jgi:hypothetical protein